MPAYHTLLPHFRFSGVDAMYRSTPAATPVPVRVILDAPTEALMGDAAHVVAHALHVPSAQVGQQVVPRGALFAVGAVQYQVRLPGQFSADSAVQVVGCEKL